MKKSLAISKSTAVPYNKETNNANMPNQYARVKNVAKGENVIKKNTDQTNVYVDEFLEEAMKKSKVQVFIKQMKMLIMNIGHQTIMLIQHLG
jgi:peroxiredoxin family protein